LCILFQLVNSYLREDYFTPNGQSTTYIDPSTGEKWYGEHPKTNPRTGIKLVLATPEMLAMATSKPPVTTPTATPASGRTFTIALKPKEKYEVDKVRQGQQWSFPTFTGQFQSRVDTGDDSACWETVENTLPWRAEKSGTLQIRTGQTDVKVTVNVQS